MLPRDTILNDLHREIGELNGSFREFAQATRDEARTARQERAENADNIHRLRRLKAALPASLIAAVGSTAAVIARLL